LKKTVCKEFKNSNRFDFPDGIVRVTAGQGGEALLILGSSKTALIDCGMSYCSDLLIRNIKEELQTRPLDYIFMSHTHYDHIGALPFIKQEWPEAIVFGAEYAKKVFEKPRAIETICSLNVNAWELYGSSGVRDIPPEGFTVDQIASDLDRISLGEEEIVVLETKGHTDCSLTFVLEPQRIMFLSETTGVLESPIKMHIAILKKYKDAMASLEKCRSYGAKRIVSPHYGIVPECFNETYWDLFFQEAEERRIFLFELFQRNSSEEEALEAYTDHYWVDALKAEQPKQAFLLNAVNIIKVYLEEYKRLGQ